MSGERGIRAFIAVELPPGVKAALKAAQDTLRKTGADVRWVRPDGVHLTLKFLGDTDPGLTGGIGAALRAALAGKGAVGLRMSGTGVFPNPKSPRVVWAGLSGDLDALTEIQRIVEEVCEGFGFERETRPFRPHLTLGRVKSGRGSGRLMEALEEAGKALEASFTADRVCLMRSELRPAGAVYTALEQILLG